MKKFKFYFWLSITIIALTFFILIFPTSREYVDKHSGAAQLLGNAILAVITLTYVFLTREILKTQKEELEYKMQYLIEPRISKVVLFFNPPRISMIIKNASAFSAGGVKGYVFMKARFNGKNKYFFYYGKTEKNALIPGEELSFDLELTKIHPELSTTVYDLFLDVIEKSLTSKEVYSFFLDLIKNFLTSGIEDEDEIAKIMIFVRYKKLNGNEEYVLRNCHYLKDNGTLVLSHDDSEKFS